MGGCISSMELSAASTADKGEKGKGHSQNRECPVFFVLFATSNKLGSPIGSGVFLPFFIRKIKYPIEAVTKSNSH
jgi:hypothetical protein